MIEGVASEELGKDVIGLVEIEVAEVGSFGSIEAVCIVGLALLRV